MAVTQNTYTGNGSTVLFSFTFPYLETTDIKVSVNGTVTTAYTLANATTIQFNTAPANGAAIRIYRETDDSNLQATFYPGSAIRSSDLNDNFTQNLYVTQEANNVSSAATTTANTALTNSATAISTANASSATANTALSNSQTALTQSASAVSTANSASSSASSAVSTANSAASNAATALANSQTALTQSANAVTIANQSSTTAGTALTNSQTALTQSSSAVSTAATASSNATTALSNSATALTQSASATSTANTALSTANAAASAVANAILYDTVANVAAIPASPANNDAVEVVDSTGIESFTPLSGKPVGFVGDSGLSVRLVYTTTGSTWNWIQYFPNDPENRYGDAIVTLQSDLTAAEGDITTLQGDVTQAQTDILALDSAKLDAATAASTYQTQAAMSSYLTAVPDSSVTDAKVSATAAISGSKIQAGTTTNAGALQLTDSTSSTSTTTAATPNAVKSAYDLANAAVPKSIVDAKGDLLVATANDTVARLAVGSNNQVLTADSAQSSGLKWATPAGGAWQYISSVTASNSASVTFTSGIDSTYDVYVIIGSIVQFYSAGNLRFRTSSNNGSSYDSGASDYYDSSTGLSRAFGIIGNNNFVENTWPGSFLMYLQSPSDTTYYKVMNSQASSNNSLIGFRTAVRSSASVINAIQFFAESGNIKTGTFRLYGIKNS